MLHSSFPNTGVGGALLLPTAVTKDTPTPVPSPQGGGRRSELARCLWNDGLRSQVSSPLAGEGQGGGYLPAPAIEGLAQ